MKSLKFKNLCFLFWISLSSNLVNSKPVELSKPEILLTGWNARCLQHADLNNDGLEDLVYFNLDKSYLEILYRTSGDIAPKNIRPVLKNRWEPVLEDARYIPERIFINGSVTDIAIGDLNSDSVYDIIIGSPEDGVRVFFRESNSSWSDSIELESERIRAYAKSLHVIDENGRSDLYIFTEPGLEQISFLNGLPQYPSSLFREGDKRAYGVELIDLNNDKILDWIYVVPGEEFSLKVRIGKVEGFGPELSFDITLSSFPTPLKSSSGQNHKKFCSIDSLSREAIIFSLADENEMMSKKPFEVISYDMFSTSNKESSWTMGDFNMDGIPELVSASSEKGEIFHIESDQNGFSGKVKSSPSLKGITHLSAFKNKGKTKLLVLSREEQVLGFSNFTKEKGFSFPLMIEVGAVPLATLPSISGNGKDDKVLVLCELDSEFYLKTFEWSTSNKFTVVHEYEIEEIKREPSDLFACDLNGDEKQDLLILSNRDAPVILLSDKKGGWKKVATDSVVRKSFLKGIGKEQISKILDPMSEKEGLLVAGDGFVRSIAWDEGELRVVEQFNSRDQNGELSVPIKIDWEGSGTEEIFAFHEDRYWERLYSGKSSPNLKNRWESSFIYPHDVRVFQTRSEKKLVALGKSGFQVISAKNSQKLSLKVESRFLTDLPKIRHNGIECGDFNNDGVQDLVCLDGKKNLLEFVTIDAKTQNWKSSLHFEVFEKNLHYQGKKGGLFEPREGLVLDLNGDGLDDLAFLVHDRLLMYKQIASAVK